MAVPMPPAPALVHRPDTRKIRARKLEHGEEIKVKTVDVSKITGLVTVDIVP